MRNSCFTFVLITGHQLPTETTASCPLKVSMVGPYHMELHSQSLSKGLNIMGTHLRDSEVWSNVLLT